MPHDNLVFRSRTVLDRLAALVGRDPGLASRTDALLRGVLAAPDLEEPYVTSELISIRVPAEYLERAEALVPHLKKDPELQAFGTVSRSLALRLAILRGLEALERKHTPKKKRKR